jgi:CHAT domain-containing protein/Tfp pilus assembly protein PilF
MMHRRPESLGRRRLTGSLRRIGGAVALSLSITYAVFPVLPVRAGQNPPPTAAEERPLGVGESVPLPLADDRKTCFVIRLEKGEAATIETVRTFVDPAVTVDFPDGTKITELGIRGLRTGTSLFSIVAPASGDHKLTFFRKSISIPEAAVKITFLKKGPATETDQARFDAHRLYREGDALFKQKTPDAQKAGFERYAQAADRAKASGDRALEAGIVFRTGLLRLNSNEYPKSLEATTKALELFTTADEKAGVASALHQIGVAYAYLNDRPKAIEFYERALSAWKEIGDREGQGATLSDLAPAYSALGQKVRALEIYQQAVLTLRSIGDSSREAWTLNNMSTVYSQIGEPQLALDCLRISLPLSRQAGDKSNEALALNNMGREYYNLGDYEKADEFLRQAIELWASTDNRGGQANGQSNLGQMRLTAGKAKEAAEAFGRAIELFRSVSDKRGEAQVLSFLGYALTDAKDYEKAIQVLEEAIQKLKTIDQRSYGTAIAGLGKAFAAAGQPEKAAAKYREALEIHRAVGYKTGESETLYHFAHLEADQGHLAEARTYIGQSIATLEQIRTNVTSQSLRASFVAGKRKFYDFQTDIIMRLEKAKPGGGFDIEAFQTMERTRARGLLELLRESKADIRTGVDPKLLEQERGLQQKLNARADALVRLKANPATAEQAKAAEAEIAVLLEELERTQAEIRKVSPRYAALTQPAAITMEDVRASLDADTVLLEYWMGDARSYAWLVSKTGLKTVQLPGRADIEKFARQANEAMKVRGQRHLFSTENQFRQAVAESDRVFENASTELSRLLLAPLANDLAGKRILVVADGALLFIPFAALPDPAAPGSPLIAAHEVISLPSAGVLKALRDDKTNRKPAEHLLAVIADPVFDKSDRRVKAGSRPVGAEIGGTREIGLQLSQSQLQQAAKSSGIAEAGDELVIRRIPYTRKEAESIRRFAEKTEATVALDFNASRDFALGPDLSKYRIVHFATHGIIDTTRPDLSGLVLSLVNEKGEPRDGFLRMTDVYNLRLPAELVVLSACQTGLGRSMSGEGLVGLTRGFFYAGARRLVVSLWSVNDEATADLMTDFYRAMLKENLPPAAALRRAQREMAKSKRFSAPYYWAAFNLQGDWQ